MKSTNCFSCVSFSGLFDIPVEAQGAPPQTQLLAEVQAGGIRNRGYSAPRLWGFCIVLQTPICLGTIIVNARIRILVRRICEPGKTGYHGGNA